MTEKRRREIAVAFRRKLDRNTLRKNAIEQIRLEFGVSRRSIYNYCARFGISTQ